MDILKNNIFIVVLTFASAILIKILSPIVDPAKLLLFLFVCFAVFFTMRTTQNNIQTSESRVSRLKTLLDNMMHSGYIKNNEEIPLRNVKRFKYIFLETELVNMLLELFQYEHRYTDIVYSIVFYSEAFIRQVYRIMTRQVRDGKQAKMLGDRIINHSHNLMFFSSKYEKIHIERLIDRFEQFIWSTYKMAMQSIDKEDDAFDPSPVDHMANTTFEMIA